MEVYGPPEDRTGAARKAEATLRFLETHLDGLVQAGRYEFPRDLPAFLQQPQVWALLGAQGPAVLPLTLVAGRLCGRAAYLPFARLARCVQAAYDVQRERSPGV